MTNRLTTAKLYAVEKSSKIVSVTFKDSTGATFAPTSIAWTMTDVSGATTYATGTLATMSATVEIFLRGSALALSDGFSGDAEERRLLIEATYGAGIPLRDSCRIFVRNLVAVS